jgi:anti-sigma factor RsiW
MPAQAIRGDRPITQTSEMEIDPFERALRDIEVGLAQDDPAFVRRLDREAHARRTNAALVVVLLLAAVLLLAVGLGTYSWIASISGALAFLSAFGVDRYRRLAIRIPPLRGSSTRRRR